MSEFCSLTDCPNLRNLLKKFQNVGAVYQAGSQMKCVEKLICWCESN